MARQVFFSFHYQNDIFRVNTIRQHWLTKPNRDESGYWDHSLWESTKLRGKQALKDLIESGLKGSAVTAVLIGSQTAGREWVDYEIQRSHELGKGILGIYINQIRCAGTNRIESRGRNPFTDHYASGSVWTRQSFASIYPVYDWVTDGGYNNFGAWVEAAAMNAGR